MSGIRLTDSYAQGYDDCVTCGGAGVIFTYDSGTDIVTSCPECDARDRDFEEAMAWPTR